jgi:hypothetical protein
MCFWLGLSSTSGGDVTRVLSNGGTIFNEGNHGSTERNLFLCHLFTTNLMEWHLAVYKDIKQIQGRFKRDRPTNPKIHDLSSWGSLSFVRITEELEWKSSGSGQENRINKRGDPLRWPRDTIYLQKLALTSPTSGGRSVGMARLRTKGHGVSCF